MAERGGNHDQHVKAGHAGGSSHSTATASRDNEDSSKQMNSSSESNAKLTSTNAQHDSKNASHTGVQGGTPEQHAAAGRQSHKNN